jgi:hypothetical protein
MKKLIVRCGDKMTFEVDRKELEAITLSIYDAYCFSNPDQNVDYIEYQDWLKSRNDIWQRKYNW